MPGRDNDAPTALPPFSAYHQLRILSDHVHCYYTTGTSSLDALWTEAQDSGHCTWNHCPSEVNAPQPQEPEASVVTDTDGDKGGRRDRPFQYAASLVPRPSS